MENNTSTNKFHEYTKESEVFGTHIKKLRQSSNLSLKDVENRSGISQDYIQNLENGARRVPSDSDIGKLAEVFKVDIKTLLSIAHTEVPDED
jgi:HTH-type transcriptional regulator, competence development regulator